MSQLTIGTNISSLRAQRRLADNSQELSTTFERLSSGLRINRAADDAAGLSISDSLRSDKRVFGQGIRNLNDGLSLLSIADSAIESLSNIVIRIKELAAQAANGSYGSDQRAALDSEAQTLSDEYTRIARSTKFNGRGLFYSEFGELRLQGGFGLDGGIQSGLGGAIGLGTFAASTSYTMEFGGTDGESYKIATGDLNGDGILDIVTAGTIDGVNGGYFTVRLGNGDGTFGAAKSYVVDPSIATLSLALGDVNNDGILDVAAGDNAGRVSIRLGSGNGTFGSQASFAMVTGSPYHIVISDLNGDGNADLLAKDSTSAGVFIRLGNGNGSFDASYSIQMGTTAAYNFKVGDINNDGVEDLVSVGGNGATRDVTVRLGNGDGTFGASSSYVMGAGAGAVLALGDLNNDGNLDIVSSLGTSTYVFLGSGTGTFSAGLSYAVSATRDIALGDLNGDGIIDIAGANTNSVVIGFGQGNGTFSAGASYADTDSTRSITLGDLDGDGVLDIATSGYSGTSSAGIALVRLGHKSAGVGPLLPFNLKSRADALQALAPLDRKIAQLASQRGTIGAFQARLSYAINTLGTTVENYSAAESRIRDADIADESSRLIRLNILQQAGASVLGQANLQPQIAIDLLSIK